MKHLIGNVKKCTGVAMGKGKGSWWSYNSKILQTSTIWHLRSHYITDSSINARYDSETCIILTSNISKKQWWTSLFVVWGKLLIALNRSNRQISPESNIKFGSLSHERPSWGGVQEDIPRLFDGEGRIHIYSHSVLRVPSLMPWFTLSPKLVKQVWPYCWALSLSHWLR